MEKKPVNINQLLTIIALIVVGFGVGFVLPNFKKEETSEQGKQDTTQDSSVATQPVDMKPSRKHFPKQLYNLVMILRK